MNKPVFYKSFRSRKSENISIPETSLAQSVSSERSIILDIGFGTGESSIALSQMYLINKSVVSRPINLEYKDFYQKICVLNMVMRWQ